MEGAYQREDLGKSVEILIDSQTSGKFFIKLIDTKTEHITTYFLFYFSYFAFCPSHYQYHETIPAAYSGGTGSPEGRFAVSSSTVLSVWRRYQEEGSYMRRAREGQHEG